MWMAKLHSICKTHKAAYFGLLYSNKNDDFFDGNSESRQKLRYAKTIGLELQNYKFMPSFNLSEVGIKYSGIRMTCCRCRFCIFGGKVSGKIEF